MTSERPVELRPAHIRALLCLVEARSLSGHMTRAHGSDHLWPGFVFERVPVIFYRGASEAFLAQHPDPPDGFRPLKLPLPGLDDVSLHYNPGPLRYLPAVGSVEVGGRRTAAVPLAVFRQGTPPEALVAGLIHDVFHACETGPPRPGLSLPLLSSYPELSATNNALGNLEARLLHDYLVRAPGAATDPARVAYLFSLVRRERRGPLDDRVIAYEQELETGEGLARYVEMRSLMAARDYSAGRAFEALAGRTTYDLAPALVTARLGRLSGLNVNAAGAAWWRFYHTGMALGLLADDLAPDWKARVRKGETLDAVIEAGVVYDGGTGDERELERLKDRYGYDERLDSERAFARAERKRKEELLDRVLRGDGLRVTFDVSSLVVEETWWDSGRLSLEWDPAAVDVVTSSVRIHTNGLRFRGFGTDLRFGRLPVVEDSKNRLFHVSVPSTGLEAEGDGVRFGLERGAEFGDGLEVALPGVRAKARSGYVQDADGTLYIKITR